MKHSIIPFENGKVEDSKGYVVYLAKEGKRFNLPNDNFYLPFRFKVLPPMKYYIGSMPDPEKNGNKEIKSITYRRGVVGLAEIKADEGIMVLDTMFMDGPEFIHDFVYLHECGHFFYKTEWKCDKFAVKGMLERGWNPSQVSFCKRLLRNRKRREKINETLYQFRV